MERPVSPQPFPGDAPVPLSFTLQQAAALCGITAHQLAEWTECGYVPASGHGVHRYDRDALRQILRVRDAVRAGRRPRVASSFRPSQPHAEDPETLRPEEFGVPMSPLDDNRLSLQIEMFFALNTGAPLSARQMAERFSVDENRMARILEMMLLDGSLVRGRLNGEVVYHAGRAQLHGPTAREQRIHAARRTRIPRSDSDVRE